MQANARRRGSDVAPRFRLSHRCHEAAKPTRQIGAMGRQNALQVRCPAKEPIRSLIYHRGGPGRVVVAQACQSL